jgi:hypothetical protein
MRFPRVKVECQSFYQCISRVVEGRFIFGTSEGGSVAAEFFVALMCGLEAFTGIRVLEYGTEPRGTGRIFGRISFFTTFLICVV